MNKSPKQITDQKTLEICDAIGLDPMSGKAGTIRQGILSAITKATEVAKVPEEVKLALRVILNHIEPGWGNCKTLLNEWLNSIATTASCAAPASSEQPHFGIPIVAGLYWYKLQGSQVWRYCDVADSVRGLEFSGGREGPQPVKQRKCEWFGPLPTPLQKNVAASAEQQDTALDLAIRFHNIYERLAPRFGYETRPETRCFNPETPNGKLMIAVCSEIQKSQPQKERTGE